MAAAASSWGDGAAACFTARGRRSSRVFVDEPRRLLYSRRPAWGARAAARPRGRCSGWVVGRSPVPAGPGRSRRDRIGRRPLAADPTQPEFFGLRSTSARRRAGNKLPRVPAWEGSPWLDRQCQSLSWLSVSGNRGAYVGRAESNFGRPLQMPVPGLPIQHPTSIALPFPQVKPCSVARLTRFTALP
jgi:hypothetical protein